MSYKTKPFREIEKSPVIAFKGKVKKRLAKDIKNNTSLFESLPYLVKGNLVYPNTRERKIIYLWPGNFVGCLVYTDKMSPCN